MRPFSAASIAFSLFLLISISLSNARTGPSEYWNAIMNGEAMPQVVKDLLHQNEKSDQRQSPEEKLVKDFDTNPNVIIYHNDVDPDHQEVRSSTEQKFLKDFDTKPNVIIYHRDVINQDEVGSSEDKEKLAVEDTIPGLDDLSP